MPQHFFHVPGLSFGFLGYTVLVSYLLSSLALAVMVWDGFRLKTYGMSPMGIVTMLSVCLICVVGPFTEQSHLFYPADNWKLLLTWGLDAALLAVIFAQYLIYGPAHDPLLPDHADKFYVLALLEFVVVLAGCWTFIVYYQDYYVNEICPIAILVMSVGYVISLYLRRDLRGLSVPAAWLLALSNLLLYGAVWAGNMSDPYPEAEYGYYFIYWLFGVTLALNFAYAALLPRHKRASQGAPGRTDSALV